MTINCDCAAIFAACRYLAATIPGLGIPAVWSTTDMPPLLPPMPARLLRNGFVTSMTPFINAHVQSTFATRYHLHRLRAPGHRTTGQHLGTVGYQVTARRQVSVG